MNMANILNPITFPLTGVSLIEASAGTGKTYTITNLVLRLVLGHKCKAQPIHKILLVTFTNAATAELRQRIRLKIHSALLDFYAGHSEDPVVGELIAQSDNPELSILRLSVAQKELDKAAIYTIHGFCQRMLQEHAFESGMGYQQSLILDESDYLRLAVQDFWRNEIADLKQPKLSIVLSFWNSPEALLSEVRPWLIDGIMPTDDIKALNRFNLDQKLTEYLQAVTELKRWWVSGGIAALLAETPFHGRHMVSKAAFRDAVTQFCESEDVNFSFNKGSWELLSSEKIKKALTKASADFDVKPFERFDELHRLQQDCWTLVHINFIQSAIKGIQIRLSKHKKDLGLLSPDDLLKQMRRALKQDAEVALKAAILEQYPVAIIDEFQDTDPIQYDIFSSLYLPDKTVEESLALVMIGDPKQAIYAFRGADIYTYIKAKNDADQGRQYTLGTNWRSQPGMVEAVNQLFLHSVNPFLLQDGIQFSPADAGQSNVPMIVNGKVNKALCFMTLTDIDGAMDKPLNWGMAGQLMAKQTAFQIANLLNLSARGLAKIGEAVLSAADCCVLVRDRSEAELIQMALRRQDVNSVFLIRKSVFATEVASDLFVLLQGIHQCENESAVKSALLTSLINIEGKELDRLLVDDIEWQQVLQRFALWRNNWQIHGLMQAINNVIAYFSIGDKLLGHFDDGSRRLTDLRHLIELLQDESSRIQGETQLLRWYLQQINEPDHNSESQQLRLDSDTHLVKIVTLHSAKGLEYPIVFMPFVCRYKAAKIGLYHDENKYLRADYRKRTRIIDLADDERLAEDVRLLYVGLTRAKYHCSVGVWHSNQSGNSRTSGIVKSALGYLLLSGKQASDGDVAQHLQKALADLETSEHTEVIHFNADHVSNTILSELDKPPIQQNELNDASHLKAGEPVFEIAELNRPIMQSWQMTSYSALSKQQQSAHKSQTEDLILLETLKLDEGSSYGLSSDDESLDKYQFPRGASAGSFLHGILEVLTFDDLTSLNDVIEQKVQWYGIDEKWIPLLQRWIPDILACSLNKDNSCSLASLNASQYLPEMEFYLPINHLSARAFNQILNEKTTWANREYQFNELTGILKGFIDLVYEVDEQYFVADYKSNHLGNLASDYERSHLHRAMEEHDYHLQGIIYTLALHRWLKQQLPGYHYEKHIGGATYLFLRGMDSTVSGSGVYHFKPDQSLILALDNLFSGGPLGLEELDKKANQSLASSTQLGLDFGVD
jgi:exodeoxyribonuclease V beta subunit